MPEKEWCHRGRLVSERGDDDVRQRGDDVRQRGNDVRLKDETSDEER
jgi:hypothetical protein